MTDYELREKQTTRGIIKWSVLGVWTLIMLIGGLMVGCPRYNVWQQEMEGKAELSRAQQNRQIKIEEAKAKLESAKFEKKTDSVRAVGTAEANRIISQSLTPEYIQWKWVEGLHDGTSETIYIPTEANLPIMEATRGFNDRSSTN